MQALQKKVPEQPEIPGNTERQECSTEGVWRNDVAERRRSETTYDSGQTKLNEGTMKIKKVFVCVERMESKT